MKEEYTAKLMERIAVSNVEGCFKLTLFGILGDAVFVPQTLEEKDQELVLQSHAMFVSKEVRGPPVVSALNK